MARRVYYNEIVKVALAVVATVSYSEWMAHRDTVAIALLHCCQIPYHQVARFAQLIVECKDCTVVNEYRARAIARCRRCEVPQLQVYSYDHLITIFGLFTWY